MTAGFNKVLLEFGEQAQRTARDLERRAGNLRIAGIRRKVPLQDFLQDAGELPSFSFLEYRYKQDGTREPGLRFRVEQGEDFLQVHVQWFHDLLIWDIDHAGRRMFDEPIWFDLAQGEVRAHPHPTCTGLYNGCQDWRSALERTLCLPVADR